MSEYLGNLRYTESAKPSNHQFMTFTRCVCRFIKQLECCNGVEENQVSLISFTISKPSSSDVVHVILGYFKYR